VQSNGLDLRPAPWPAPSRIFVASVIRSPRRVSTARCESRCRRRAQCAVVDRAVAPDEPDEAGEPGIRLEHAPQQPLDFVRITDQLGTGFIGVPQDWYVKLLT
jgi:hypothetical protein